MKHGKGLSPRRRQARALLLGAAVAFALTQAVLAVAIDDWLPILGDTVYVFRRQRLERRLGSALDRPTTVVMLGSSRTMFGFDAPRVQAQLAAQLPAPPVVHNFGVPGAGPINHRLHLERLLADGIHPDLVLVEVTPQLLLSADGIPSEKELITPTRLRRQELALLDQYHLPTRAARAEWWQRWAVPCYYYRFALVSAVSPSLLPVGATKHMGQDLDEACWRPLPSRAGALETAAHQREVVAVLQANAASLRLPLCTASCCALRDTVELCRRENIGVALVWMPEAAAFRQLYPPGTKTTIWRFLQQLQQTQGTPLIDASDWIGDDEFSNPHYLLATGAADFAQRLSRELLPLLTPCNGARGGPRP
jgi:hypothetical protein